MPPHEFALLEAESVRSPTTQTRAGGAQRQAATRLPPLRHRASDRHCRRGSFLVPPCSQSSITDRSSTIQPVPVAEEAPTTEEATFLRDARLVPSLSEAEKAVEKAPKHGEGEWAAEKGKKGGEVERALEEATGVKSEEASANLGAVGAGDGDKEQKRGWWGFGWGK